VGANHSGEEHRRKLKRTKKNLRTMLEHREAIAKGTKKAAKAKKAK
jgi:hypothetical protein